MVEFKDYVKTLYIRTALNKQQNRHEALKQYIHAIRRHINHGKDFNIGWRSEVWLHNMSDRIRTYDQSWLEWTKKQEGPTLRQQPKKVKE